MEKKRWVLIFSAVCLALVFSVSSVEAQICDPGAFCDRDGDTFIRDHRKCMECFGEIDCDDSASSNVNSCVDVDSGMTFSVDVLAGSGGVSPFVVTDTCVGLTTVNLSVNFPISPGCGEVTVIDGTGQPLKLFLFALNVKNTKKETSARLNFTSSSCCHGGEFGYVTDAWPAVVEAGPPGSSFQIRVDALDVNLRKIHQPDKGEMVGTISIGTMVYTAQ